MSATDPTTPTTPTTPALPAKWYESPTFKYVVGIVLSVALALLASKFGIAPAAVPGVPQANTPSVLVLNVSPTPATLGRSWPITAVDTLMGTGWRVENQALSGTDCMTVAGKISTGSTALYDGTLSKNVYCHFLGTNDLGAIGRTAAQLITDTDTCLTAMRAAGFVTAVATIPDRTGSASWDGTKDGYRQTFNTAVRSGGALNSLVDVVVDLAADSLIDDPDNTTYRAADKLHYTQVGSDRIAVLFAAGVVTI